MPSRSRPTRVGSTLRIAVALLWSNARPPQPSPSSPSSRLLLLAAAQQQQCTVCADGSPAEGTLEGGTDCGMIDQAVGMTPATDPECAMVRLQGFMSCNCPTFPAEDYCSMCPYDGNGTAPYEPLAHADRPVPTLGGVPCREAEFLASDDSRCGNALPEAAWFCGCGGGGGDSLPRGDCFLCGSASDATAPNARPLPPPLDPRTCDQVDREGGLFYNVAGAEEACPALLLGETWPAQFDYESYCGCSGGGAPPADATCALCGSDDGGGGQVQNPDSLLSGGGGRMTCAELAVAVLFVTDGDYCGSLVGDHADLCCNPPQPTTGAPVAAATPAPAAGAAPPAPLTPAPSRAPAPTSPTTSAAATPKRAGGVGATAVTVVLGLVSSTLLCFVLEHNM